jgi:hypothetical protein
VQAQHACCVLSVSPVCPDGVCGQLDALHEEAGSILEDLRSVLPERNLGVPNAGFSRPHPPSAAGSDRGKQAQQEELSSDDEGGESSMETGAGNKAWTFPKAHGMYHCSTTVRLFGPLQGSSGESMERRHVDIKEAFTRTNNHKDCEVQVLRGEMRMDDSSAGCKRQHDGQDGQAGAAKRPRLNASFGDTLHRSARRYAVWHAAQHWRDCKRHLMFEAVRTHELTERGWQSQARVTIRMQALYDASSEWRMNCVHMRHLPAELARYIRDEFSAQWAEGRFPMAGEDTLTWAQVVELCGMVQTINSRSNQGAAQAHGPSETHLQVFNALQIVHPDVPDEVNADRDCNMHVVNAQHAYCT